MPQPEFPEPHEGIDPFNNKEAKARDAGVSSLIARGGAGEAPESGSAPATEQVDQAVSGGTADGDATSGVEISPEDAAGAVSGDTGPENPGERRG